MPPPAPAAARRRNQISRPTSSRVGPKPSSTCCQIGRGASGGLALTGTPFACSLANRLSSANDGRWVVNRSTCSAFLSPTGVYGVLAVSVPSMVSAVEVMSVMFFASTWERKNVYDTGVRGSGASRNEEMIQFSASRISSIQPKRCQAGRRFGGVGLGWPSGAPSTRHGGGAGGRSSPERLGTPARDNGPFCSDPGVVMAKRYSGRVPGGPEQ
jgi:hypothetical protein